MLAPKSWKPLKFKANINMNIYQLRSQNHNIKAFLSQKSQHVPTFTVHIINSIHIGWRVHNLKSRSLGWPHRTKAGWSNFEIEFTNISVDKNDVNSEKIYLFSLFDFFLSHTGPRYHKRWLSDITIRLTGTGFGYGSSSHYQLNTFWLEGLRPERQVCWVTRPVGSNLDIEYKKNIRW